MAERRRRALQSEQTGHFVIYDRRTGHVLAVHHLTALPGVRVPSDEAIVRRLRACTAEALGRPTNELGILRTREAPLISSSLRVDVAAGKLRTDGRPTQVAAERPQGEAPPSALTRP